MNGGFEGTGITTLNRKSSTFLDIASYVLGWGVAEVIAGKEEGKREMEQKNMKMASAHDQPLYPVSFRSN